MLVATFFTIILAWVILFPLDALKLIRKLRTQHRQKVIQRYGKRGANILSERLHAWASEQGFDAQLVDEILAEHHSTIVQRVREKQANMIRGREIAYFNNIRPSSRTAVVKSQS